MSESNGAAEGSANTNFDDNMDDDRRRSSSSSSSSSTKASTSSSHSPRLLSFYSVVAGACSSVATKAILHPIDTVKAQMQVAGALGDSATARSSALRVAGDVLRGPEGVAGLYRGLGAVVAGGLPGAAAYFSGAEAARAFFSSHSLSSSSSSSSSAALVDTAVGVSAQLVGGLVFTPVDVVKERRQAQRLFSVSGSSSPPPSPLSSSLSLSSLRGLFKGYWATNAVWIPWSGIYFAGYEATKRALMERGRGRGSSSSSSSSFSSSSSSSSSPPPPPAPPPACVVLFSSAAAASGAALLTHPIDVVKTRMQVLSGVSGSVGGGGGGRGVSSPPPSTSTITARSVALAAWRTEGPRAFLAGVGPRALQLATGTALQWLMYEKGKEAIERATAVIEDEADWV